jgi:hypothetical protein
MKWPFDEPKHSIVLKESTMNKYIRTSISFTQMADPKTTDRPRKKHTDHIG